MHSTDNEPVSRGAVLPGSGGPFRQPGFRLRQTVGKYRLDKRLAEGGYATVFRALDLVEGVPVALKIPNPQFQGEQALLEFRREGRVLARLEHPNILPVKNAMVHNGILLIAFPLGEQALSDRLEKRIAKKTALNFAHQILRAVAWAHSCKVIHLDIKPENFVLFRDGRVRLTDFGIAHISWKTKAFDTLAGTPGYMAPEQAMGRPSARSDVFSLGLVLYKMFTGILPNWPFEWPPPRFDRLERNFTPGMGKILKKATMMDARRRYPNACEMLLQFEKVLERELPDKRSPAENSIFLSQSNMQSEEHSL